ncbi:MAG TPA: lysoplasmalogenase [Candidatus Hydrogenedentes bacterium]|nr:lysoplasmalogenase [Candidatus Hydrogenedentota bacterium]
MPIIYSIVFFLLAAAGTLRKHIHIGLSTGVIKTLPVLFLVLCAFTHTRKRFGFWVVLGVGLGAMGDYGLAQPGRIWDGIGVLAFLLGHVAYSVAFCKDLKWTAGRGIVIGLTLLFMVAVLAAYCIKNTLVGQGEVVIPVMIYVTVMAVMMTLAVLHQSPTWLIAAGAVFFVISDAHLAVNHTILNKSNMWLTYSSHFTYYFGQYLLVAGAAYETRHYHPKA